MEVIYLSANTEEEFNTILNESLEKFNLNRSELQTANAKCAIVINGVALSFVTEKKQEDFLKLALYC